MVQQNLCNHSKKEICNALQIIQDICQFNECSICPFGYNSNSCKIQDNAPCDYDLADENSTWKAFR